MDLLLPSSIKAGDTIGVFSPSSYVEKDDIERSKALMEKRGYKVFIHPQTYERHNQSAGTHLQKALAFQGLWQRKDIDIIWAAGGGNRATHLLDTINFNRLKDNPKPLIGFSDVTSLLNSLYAQTGIVTFHGPVFKNLHKYNELDHLLSLLGGERVSYPLANASIINDGKARGHLIGGNLSLFQYLPQTLSDEFYKGAVLFLEDCNEELSRIDRMLLHLKRIGVLNNISALLLGQFSDISDSAKPFGFTLDDIIAEHSEGLNIPILGNLPFGHGKNLYTFPIGVDIEIDTTQKSLNLLKPATALR